MIWQHACTNHIVTEGFKILLQNMNFADFERTKQKKISFNE